MSALAELAMLAKRPDEATTWLEKAQVTGRAHGRIESQGASLRRAAAEGRAMLIPDRIRLWREDAAVLRKAIGSFDITGDYAKLRNTRVLYVQSPSDTLFDIAVRKYAPLPARSNHTTGPHAAQLFVSE